MTKFLQAGEATGFAYEKSPPVEVGKTYGHLEVLEELPHVKGSAGGRRFRVRCVNVTDEATGAVCGRLTVKRTPDLTKATKFRACKECTEAYMKLIRNRWNKGVAY